MSDKNETIKFSLKQVIGLIVGVVVIFGGQSYITKDNNHFDYKQTTINENQIHHLEKSQMDQKERLDKIALKYESIKDSIHSVDTKVSVLKETNESLKKQLSLVIHLLQEINKQPK